MGAIPSSPPPLDNRSHPVPSHLRSSIFSEISLASMDWNSAPPRTLTGKMGRWDVLTQTLLIVALRRSGSPCSSKYDHICIYIYVYVYCDFHLCKYHAIPWVISRSSNNHLMFNRRCQGSDCLAAGGWDLSTLEPFSFGALCQHRVLHRFGRGRPSNSLVQISVLRQGRKHRQCDPIWLGEGNIHWTGIHTVSSIQSLIRPLQFQQRVLYHLHW